MRGAHKAKGKVNGKVLSLCPWLQPHTHQPAVRQLRQHQDTLGPYPALPCLHTWDEILLLCRGYPIQPPRKHRISSPVSTGSTVCFTFCILLVEQNNCAGRWDIVKVRWSESYGNKWVQRLSSKSLSCSQGEVMESLLKRSMKWCWAGVGKSTVTSRQTYSGRTNYWT